MGKRMSQDNNDNYPVAAVRHFVDGEILYEQNRWDNSMCHYAFSAECAMKTLYKQLCSNKEINLGHDIDKDWTDIQQYFSALKILDARAGTMLDQLTIPEKLFENHPSRRYRDDILYTSEDMQKTVKFAKQLIQKIVSMALDGRLY